MGKYVTFAFARKSTESESDNDIAHTRSLSGYLLAQVFVCDEIEEPEAYGLFTYRACERILRGQTTDVSGVNRFDQTGRLADQPIRSLAQRADGLRRPELDDYVWHFGRRLSARIMGGMR